MTGKQVPNAELEVLACLNRMGLATARQIREAMLPFRPMNHGSVFTLLARLEVKGLVTKEKGPAGKAFVYSIAKRGGKVFPDVLHWFLHVFAEDSIQFVASFFDINPPMEEPLGEAVVTRRLGVGLTALLHRRFLST